MKVSRRPIWASVFLALLLVSACSGLPPDYLGGRSGSYVVKKGDTLYSIAFRYGLDYKSLARRNGIRPPYTIYANQKLKLKGSAKLPEKDYGPVATTSKKTSSNKKTVQRKPAPIAPVSTWQWPVKGKVIASFSLKQPVNKGIDIASRRGEKVKAAADGTVVYAGGNLRGYGKLVIIKHNENYLSAYGNNEDLLVKEGQFVTAGKSIAKVGVSASDVEMLHFEIRRDGKPENPLRYLPKTGT